MIVIFQYKMLFSIRKRGGTLTLSVSLYNSPFVSSVRKCKDFDKMVVIYRDKGCFMVEVLDLENMMVIFYTKCYFLSEQEGVLPPSVFFCKPRFSIFFSGVELELCLLSENLNIFIK